MTERAFWHFVWLAGVRLPFEKMPLLTAIHMSAWGCWTLIHARYLKLPS